MVTKAIQTFNKDIRRAVDHARRLGINPVDVCGTLFTYGIVIGLKANVNIRELFEQLVVMTAKDLPNG